MADDQELTLLDKIVSEGKMARDESQQSYAKDLIGEFVDLTVTEAKPNSLRGELIRR